MAKCPLWVITLLLNPYKRYAPEELQPLNEDDTRLQTTLADCKESDCQMWDAERADCGLKQPAKKAKKTKKIVLPPPSPNSFHEI